MALEHKPETVHIQSTTYRYSSYDTPLWTRPNSEAGRWHSPEDGPTQYLSMTTDGAWADLIRHEELSSEYEVSLVNIQMWAIKVDQALVVDYSTFEKAEAAGLNPETLIDDNLTRSRQEGARLRSLGYAGVLAPSAALPGARNLTLFGARTASSWSQPPLLASSMPTSIVAVGGPPAGLLAQVRRYGLEHPDFRAYREGRTVAPSDTEE
jgi:RES domain-containing protein